MAEIGQPALRLKCSPRLMISWNGGRSAGGRSALKLLLSRATAKPLEICSRLSCAQCTLLALGRLRGDRACTRKGHATELRQALINSVLFVCLCFVCSCCCVVVAFV